MNFEQMKKDIGMENCPGCFAEIYEEIKDEWKNRASLILSEAYIEGVLTEAKVLLPYMETVLSAAAKVREMRRCACLCVFLKSG